MKAFVVLALVACVASQSVDRLSMNYRFKPTHNKMSNFENLLMKEKLVGQDMYNTEMDFDTVFGGRKVELYSIEELISHPIFREYMRLPYFHQLWQQNPIVFRKYVESPLFQQFWMIPEFQMYFRNPVLYVKYIVPQLEVISQVVSHTVEGRYNYDTPTYNKYVPYAYRHHNQWSIPMSMDKTFNSFPFTTSTTETNYRYLLEKMMNHLNFNKQDLTETVTDVKMLPSGKVLEKTLIVDPITGMLVQGDIKTVDKKIVPVQSMDFPYGLETLNNKFNTESTKDAILKHIILQKMLGNKRIPVSVYETLFKDNEDIFNTPEIYNTIYKNKNVIEIPEMLETILGNKKVFSHETLFNNKDIMTPEVLEAIFGQKVHEILSGNKMTPQSLETIFGKTIYNPRVYSSLFDDKWTVPEYTEEHIYEPYMTKEVSPFVTRMLKNNKISKFQKYQTEKVIEEIKKEKMMEQLMKEYPTLINKETIEFPKMFETEQGKVHIPLTFKVPVSGSILQGFEQEKEIKY